MKLSGLRYPGQVSSRRFAAACMLLLTITQYALSLPSFSARFCSTAW